MLSTARTITLYNTYVEFYTLKAVIKTARKLSKHTYARRKRHITAADAMEFMPPATTKAWISGVQPYQGTNHEPAVGTVPGFYQRRGCHATALNEHNYAEELSAQAAIFPFNSLRRGPMANFLHQATPSPAKEAPTGRARATPGFFE